MELKFFCPHWGQAHLSWSEFSKNVVAAGYDGAEIGIASGDSKEEIEQIVDILEDHGLEVVLHHYDTITANFEKHYDQFKAWLDKMTHFSPYFINSQTGRDLFSFEQNSAIIDLARQFNRDCHVQFLHETHRGRFSFAAHIMKEYLEKIPDLNITLDASHWVNVAESWLDDQREVISLAAAKTRHIHARVGHTQGPQVPDPRVDAWKHALDTHIAWWDEVISQNKGNGLTITPEFGPEPYMTHLPTTNEPIASQWDINIHMMNILKERYQG